MATWEERNAKARQAGFRNYYDYRIHGYGKIPPDEKVTGERLAKARGHRSLADLEKMVAEGDTVAIWNLGPRDDLGRYRWVDVMLKKENGEELMFRLRGRQLSSARLQKLVANVEKVGGIFSPAPSLDIRRMIEELEDEGVDGEEE